MDKNGAQQLLPGECVVASNEILTLTNYRVVRDASASGGSRYVSISLDAISSCGLVTASQPILLILGICAALGAFVLKGDAAAGAFVLGAALIVAYFMSRSAVMSICSTGGERITVPTKPSQRALQRTLLDAIDQAKLAALGRLVASPPHHAMPPRPSDMAPEHPPTFAS